MNREAYLNQISVDQPVWDVLVIGGGATGLGIALDATARGYKTLLLEQSDFAKGTSSRSTKLIHGGVRYLAQGDILLVREASVERGLLLRNAPHLVRDISFIVPVYSWWDRIIYTLGLKIYDRIAGKLRLGNSIFIPRDEVIEKLPAIRNDGLIGGVLYHDGQFDDSRLAINLAQTIWENGGHALNYVKVTGIIKNNKHKTAGVEALDIETGQSFTFKAKAVVNATGVFVDDILQMDNPGSDKTICVSQGVHVVLDKSFFPSRHALMIPKTSDGRVLFAVPWHDKVVIGTTDTPVDQVCLEPSALESEIDFILETSSNYLKKTPQRSDVLSIFAGLRPLAAPKKGRQKTKEISRSHKIVVSSSGLLTILGGKWTTYRSMGEDMVNRIEKELHWPRRSSPTASLRIHGSVSTLHLDDPFYFYGSDAPLLRDQINRSPEDWVNEKLNIHKAQVIWAVEHEMARTIEDVLSRRTRALLLNARESISIATKIADIMAEALHKDEHWIREQVTAFEGLAKNYVPS